ncbi:MAG: hypothetical protein ACREH8_10965 [Opitutaceae bacterium]
MKTHQRFSSSAGWEISFGCGVRPRLEIFGLGDGNPNDTNVRRITPPLLG